MSLPAGAFPAATSIPCSKRCSKTRMSASSASTRRTRPKTPRAFLAELGNPYDAIGADTNGRVSIDWGVYGVPETFVVDAAGIIRFKHVGPIAPSPTR